MALRRVLLILLLSGCQTHPRAPVRIAAAISLKAPLDEVGRNLAQQGVQTELVFGASGDLSRQIAAGAPIDLFASAAAGPLEELEKNGQARLFCELARNRLVLIRRLGPALADLRWETLATAPAVRYVAIGLAHAVPAGDYAEQALGSLGIWEAVAPRLVRGGNVRQVLELVARGEADAGIVYATDVAGRSDLVVVGEPPPGAAPRISYQLGMITGGSHTAEQQVAIERVGATLCGAEGRSALRAAGFAAP